MEFKDFTDITVRFWRKYLNEIAELHREGKVDSGGGKLLFPNIIMSTNCDGYYVAELVGATPAYVGLSEKKSKGQSIYRYLSQFDDSVSKPLFVLDGHQASISRICLAHENDAVEVRKRFPIIDSYKSGLAMLGGVGSLFDFADTFEFVSIHNCLLVNQKNKVYRCKNILSLFIVRSAVTAKQLKDFYSSVNSHGEVAVVHTVAASDEALAVAGQFQNMYLSQGIHETTLGEFLKLHPDVIYKAFSCDSFLYEKSFKWIKSRFAMDEAEINPDLLVRRSDGFYDIYDLKTAAFSFKSLTSRKSSRRKFIEYVYDGIAQLHNYSEYFKVPENAQYALEVHGVRVSKPRLVLVVGSWENALPHEIEQASELHQDVTIIDYDTFCQLYISAAVVKERNDLRG